MDSDEIGWLGVAELGALYRARQLSPVEVAKWFIRHVVSYDGDFSLVGEVPCVAQRFACAN
jgi:hypothetical protein